MAQTNKAMLNKKHSFIDHSKWPFTYFFGSMPQNTTDVSLVKLKTPLEFDYSIVFVGDMLGLNDKLPQLSLPLQEFINKADLFVGNLECTLSAKRGINLLNQNSDVKVLKVLKKQIHRPQILLSLANNHCAVSHFDQTKKALSELKIETFGTIEKPYYHYKGLSILAATQWLPRKNAKHINSFEHFSQNSEKNSNQNIITFLHYGDEFKLNSKLSINLPRNTILHIGHHPHVPHIPKLKEIPYFSSLGNFWTSFGGKKVRHGIILTAYFKSDELVGHDWRFIQSTPLAHSVELDFCDKVDYFL